jgi:hypothetical protein
MVAAPAFIAQSAAVQVLDLISPSGYLSVPWTFPGFMLILQLLSLGMSGSAGRKLASFRRPP